MPRRFQPPPSCCKISLRRRSRCQVLIREAGPRGSGALAAGPVLIALVACRTLSDRRCDFVHGIGCSAEAEPQQPADIRAEPSVPGLGVARPGGPADAGRILTRARSNAAGVTGALGLTNSPAALTALQGLRTRSGRADDGRACQQERHGELDGSASLVFPIWRTISFFSPSVGRQLVP